MARIIVEQVSRGEFKAYIEGDKCSWEAGGSVDEVVGKMRVSYPELINAPVFVEG